MTEYDKLTVVKLREELVNRGLPKTGLKAALIQRLVEADAQSEQQTPAAERGNVQLHPQVQLEAKESTIVPEAASEGPELTQAQAHYHEETNYDAPIQASASSAEDIEGTSESAVYLTNGIPLEERPAKDEEDTISSTDNLAGKGSSESENQHPTEAYLETKSNLEVAAGELRSTNSEADVDTPKLDEATAPVASQVPGSPTADPPFSTQTSALGSEEVREDTNKRKRRSQTPPPSSIEIAQKRVKADDGRPHVKLPEDETNKTVSPIQKTSEPGDSVMVDAPSEGVSEKTIEKSSINGDAQIREDVRRPEIVIPRTGDLESTESLPPPESQTVNDEENLLPREQEQTPAKDATLETSLKQSPSDTRFKNLFTGPSKREGSLSRQKVHKNSEDRVISPALHSATSALYIRDFMRPIKADTLKAYLSALACPPDSDQDPGIITEFFLDSVKTHCLVAFANTSAAARVRLGLHDRVWPDEKNRKPLWVDFVPEEKLRKWIDVETEATNDRRQGFKKWEVVYEKEDGDVVAFLQEAGPNSNPPRAVQPMMPRKESMPAARGSLPASGPKDAATTISQPSPTGKTKTDAGKGFQALDELFKVTAAKPMLYYLPVAQETVQRRQDRLAAGRGGGKSDEKRRYTFEDGSLVDKGPEFGFGRRGGYGGRGGGGYGGYPGRGGGYRGDNWRGRRP
ncbi:MAG: hypothetical protein Q9195_004397 [Heterodermia aff. obscurata]